VGAAVTTTAKEDWRDAASNSRQGFDEPAIRRHVEMIHGLATGADGVIVVCVYGEDPKRVNPKTGKTGCPIHKQVMRFAIGDVEETVSTIMAYEGVEHANIYMPLHVVRRGLKSNQRGKLKDLVAVLGLVGDADSDTGKAGTACPVKPSVVLETSPGNSQPFILFDRHVTAADAVPVAKALRAAMKTDSGTGDVAHVWRVPGTLNWPNAKKLERGRDPAPIPVKVLTPWDGSRHSFDDVKEAVSRWEAKPGDAHANKDRSSSTDPQEILARLPLALQLALQAAPPAGIDRSRYAFGILCSLLNYGLTNAEIHSVTAAFPGNIFARYNEEGKDLDAEIRRAKEKLNETAEAASADFLTRMNEEYAIVRGGGKTRVLYFDEQPLGHSCRKVATFMSFEDFRNFHGREYVRGPGQQSTPLGQWWLRHPEARQYKGVIFDPSGAPVVGGKLNLSQGFAIKPKAGKWSLMKRHILEIIAAGDKASEEYILNWMTWLVQNPGEQAGVALVLKGDKGSGKGTLGNVLCRIFGQHSCHLSSAKHLAGNFNAHLLDCCFLFADEAYWAGDRGAEGTLKRLITEPTLFIEAKGRDGVTVPNRLHVMMASNNEWVVPASHDERRYAVFQVSDHKKQDKRWFDPLYAELNSGGCAAMLDELLRLDLWGWHPREVLKTAALQEQQSQSLREYDEWLIGLLQGGVLAGARGQVPGVARSRGYEEDDGQGRRVKRKGLFDQAVELSPGLRNMSEHKLGEYLKKWGCTRVRNSQHRLWQFPPLWKMRADWEKKHRGWEWHDPGLNEWRSDE
jgi:hypothetical protein